MRMEDLQNRYPCSKECMSKMLMTSLWNILKKKEELSRKAHVSTIILSAGEVIRPSSIKLWPPGSLESLLSKMTLLRTIKKQPGFQRTFKMVNSITGSVIVKIGASQETDSGVIPFPFGSLRMENRLFALDQSNSLKSLLELRSQICIDNILIIWPLKASKEKESSDVLKKFLTVGSKVDPCLMLKSIIPSLQMKNNSTKYSQLISLDRELIRPEDGSIPWMSSALVSETVILTKISSLTALCLLKTAKRCPRDLKTTLILLKYVTNLVQMLWDYTSSTLLLSKLTTWTSPRREWNQLWRKFSYHGITPIVSSSKIYQNMRPGSIKTSCILRTSKFYWTNTMWLTNGFSLPFRILSEM